MPEPTPVVPQAKVIAIAAAGHILYTLGDDGSLYRLTNPNVPGITPQKENWEQILHTPPY
jgi:hypothetical protein